MIKRSKTLKTVGLALVGLSSALSGQAMAAMQVETDGGLYVYEPESCAYWFSLGGRLDIDEIVFSGSFRDRQSNFPTSANIRRAFLGMQGGVGNDWTYNLTLDFGRVASTVFIEEAWLGYGFCDGSRVRFGQMTPITTLDGYGNYGLSNGQMFLESALATSAFSVPTLVNGGATSFAMKSLGIMFESQMCDMFTVAATVYQPGHGIGGQGLVTTSTGLPTTPLPVVTQNDPGRGDRVGEALRITFVPIHEQGSVFHLGVMGRNQSVLHTTLGNAPILTHLFATTPEVVPRNAANALNLLSGQTGFSTTGINSANPFLVDAGFLRAKSYNHLAAELATICGQTTLAAEYHNVNVQRVPLIASTQRGNVSFHGWHVQGGYVLTGETRDYNFCDGTLGGIRPINCDFGAWEVIARYSFVNMINKDVYGGAEHNTTLGVNWYANNHVRFGFNYIYADITPTGTLAGTQPAPGTAKRRLDIFGLRAEVTF